MVKWVKSHCVVCGVEYQYPESKNYKPKTCNKYECVHEFAQHPDRYITFEEHLDECRKRAGI